jgi:hypothetical protein
LAAPEPRPPHPTTPTRIVSLPRASAKGTAAPPSTSAPADTAELLNSSRLVIFCFCTMFASLSVFFPKSLRSSQCQKIFLYGQLLLLPTQQQKKTVSGL